MRIRSSDRWPADVKPVAAVPPQGLPGPVGGLRRLLVGACCMSSVLLAGCSSGGGIGSAIADAFGVPKVVTVNGFVIGDAPVAGAAVTARCKNGLELATTTDAGGAFELAFQRNGGACMLRATGGQAGVGAASSPYFAAVDTTAYALGRIGVSVVVGPLSTLETVLVSRRDPAEVFGSYGSDVSAPFVDGGRRAILNVLALTQFDPSALAKDWRAAYGNSMGTEAFTVAPDDPLLALSRAWTLYLNQSGTPWSTVLATARRDGHLTSLPGATKVPTPQVRQARADASSVDARTSCVGFTAPAVGVLQTCAEPIVILACPVDAIVPGTAPVRNAPPDLRSACWTTTPGEAVGTPDWYYASRFEASRKGWLNVLPSFDGTLRGAETVPAIRDSRTVVVAACKDRTIPRFLTAPDAQGGEFTFTCRSDVL